MGKLVTRAIDEAGFTEICERALRGNLSANDLERLRTADTLVLSAIADQVRAKFHGDQVTLVATRNSLPSDVDDVVVSTAQRIDGVTGEEALRLIAIARLTTTPSRPVAVSWDHIGLHLAQTALLFGANVLFGGIGHQGVLPLADNPGIRKDEITGLVQRARREPHWAETAQLQLGSRS